MKALSYYDDIKNRVIETHDKAENTYNDITDKSKRRILFYFLNSTYYLINYLKMETYANGIVEDEMVSSLSCKFDPTASYETDRKSVTYNAQGSKYMFSNPGGNLSQRWIRFGITTYPTNQVGDAESTIFRSSFVQDIAQYTDYSMIIQFKMSSTAFGSPPFYGTCNYYLFSNGALDYPGVVVSQTRNLGASTTFYEFFMDLGYGTTPGGVSPARASMIVNGTAPCVLDGSLLSNPTGTTKYITPQVLYSSFYKPPANQISGLNDYIYNNASQKCSHPNVCDQTGYYRLGLLVLPQNGFSSKSHIIGVSRIRFK